MWELVGGLVKAGHVSTLALCPSLLDALLASQRLDLVEKLLRHLRDVPRAALEAVLLAALPPDGATLLRTHRVGTRARWRWSPATLVHRNATCIVLSGTWVCLRCDARGAREPGAAGRRRQGRGAHGAAHGGGDNPGNPGASAHGTHRRRRRAVGARPLLALCLPLCLSHCVSPLCLSLCLSLSLTASRPASSTRLSHCLSHLTTSRAASPSVSPSPPRPLCPTTSFRTDRVSDACGVSFCESHRPTVVSPPPRAGCVGHESTCVGSSALTAR
jgi:hypothetical protein